VKSEFGEWAESKGYGTESLAYAWTKEAWTDATRRQQEPQVFEDQKHLDEGSQERIYWHCGYRQALVDVVAFLNKPADKPPQPEPKPSITDLAVAFIAAGGSSWSREFERLRDAVVALKPTKE
jgi:hypothetical protein